MDVIKAYRDLDLSIPRYLLLRVLPLFLCGLFASIFFAVSMPDVFLETYFIALLYIIPIFTIVVGLVYPLIAFEKRKLEIDRQMHFFITRLGVLSASRISDKGIMDLLVEMKKHDEISKEVDKLYALVDKWNMAVPDACRTVAMDTPSDILADFLERLAYAFETQLSPLEFFKDEQKTVMDDYANEYENMLFRLDLLQELYVSAITLGIFVTVLGVLIPLIMDVNSTLFIYLVFMVFAFITSIFCWIFLRTIPKSEVWDGGENTETVFDKRLKYLILLSAAVTGLLALILFFYLDFIPLMIKFGLIFTPFLVPGLYTKIEERKILRRDVSFPSFIRSLAGSGKAKGSGFTDALRKLRYHDFGHLTDNIRDLYRRLKMNIDSERSWRFFGAETRSYLITHFSNMYLKASEAGADPDEAASIISENFIRILGLRNKKLLHAKSLTGVLYGVIVALSLSQFAVYGIVKRINGIMRDIEMPSEYSGLWSEIGFIRTAPYDITDFFYIIISVVLIQALVGAIITWHARGEHKTLIMYRFSMMVWIAAIVGQLSMWGVSLIFSP